MNLRSARTGWAGLGLLLAFALGCTETLRVQGVVTNALDGSPIEGASVTLYSTDGLPGAKTDAAGFFVFDSVARTSGLILTVAAAGFDTEVVELEPQVSVEGSEKGTDTDALNASVRLFPTKEVVPPVEEPEPLTFAVGGWVYAGDVAAVGAQVALWLTDPLVSGQPTTGRYVAWTTTKEKGRFDLAGLEAGNYTLRVWPFDENGDGLTDFRLFSRELPNLGTDPNLEFSNQVVVLEQPSTDLLASSFSALSTQDAQRPRGYPVRGNELGNGITGVLRSGAADLFLHFAAEVDTDLAVFELREVDASGRESALVGPLTVTWEHGYIVRVQPPTPFVADADRHTRFQLRIRSLRFRTGQSLFSPETQQTGSITFDVHAIPALLESPRPSLFVATRHLGPQVATKAGVDAGRVWVLDQGGDFFSGIGGQHWTDATGLTLSWSHVEGATSYRVYARNTLATGAVSDDRTHWLQLPATVSLPVEPSPDGRRVVATGVMRGHFGEFGLSHDGSSFPWLFGNEVELAVTAVDADGFESNLDGSRTLVLADKTQPMVFGGTIGASGSLPQNQPDFAVGAGFRTTIRLALSEPVVARGEPSVIAQGALVATIEQGATWWNDDTVGAAVQAASGVGLPVRVRLKQACTELTANRTFSKIAAESDVFVPVADPAVLGSASSVVVLSTTGQWLGQLTGLVRTGAEHHRQGAVVSTVDTFTAAAGSQVCALTGTGVAAVVSVAGNEVTVNDARPFSLGQQVVVLQPADCTVDPCADPVFITSTVVGLDTATALVTLNAALPALDATSVMFAWTPAAASLREAFEPTLLRDVVGGAGVKLIVDDATELLVGDQLLVDADGVSATTKDQALVTVAAVKTGPLGVELTVTLPAGMVLVHDLSSVRALGDWFRVSGLQDTSGNPMTGRNSALARVGGSLVVWSMP